MSQLKRQDMIEGMKANAYEYYLDAKEYSPEPSVYDKIAEVRNSSKAYEQATSVVEDTDPEERAEGQAMEPIKPIEGFTTYAKMRNYYKMIEVTRETAEDHQKFKSFMQNITSGWANAMIRGKNKLLLKHFNEGGKTSGNSVFNQSITGVLTDPSGDLLYDGKPLFNLSGNNRNSKGGGEYYNAIASALTAENFETLWNLMTVTNAKNEDDSEIEIRPNLLLVNGALNFTARRILESTLIPGVLNNDKNVLEGIVDLLATNYFTESTGWVLMEAKKGIQFYERETEVIDVWYDHKHKLYMSSIEHRIGVMLRNFRFFAGSNISTS